jgi:hypothetical protein
MEIFRDDDPGYRFSWHGRNSFYETSGDRLSRKTAANLAAFFGLAGRHELFVHVRDMRRPSRRRSRTE